MLIVGNILFIALAAFIAYWWANQGLFSALLHLVCVVAAGAIALAFWEPLTTRFLLRGGFFDGYAWGVSFLGLFAVSLLFMRMVMDKLAPANVSMPHWVNLIFGGFAGAASGVLTVGILVIGIGFVQSQNNLFGFRGWGRSSSQAAKIVEINRLWIPFHRLTSDFYSRLSVSSFRSAQPMRQYEPYLWRQATLVRDSYSGGRKGVLALPPDAASVEREYVLEQNDGDEFFIQVHFGLGALDSGEQLTLSSAQIRLIGRTTGTHRPEVFHPFAWLQFSGLHRFDDVTHYVTSEPGKEETEPIFIFKTPSGFIPRFIQIRNTRYRLPAEPKPVPSALVAGLGGPGARNPEPPPTGQDMTACVDVSNSIRPVSVSRNLLPGSIAEKDGFLTSGEAEFKRGRVFISRNLRIKGIYEPTGTRCVRVDVSRGGCADIFQYASTAGEDARIALVDSSGSSYTPVGYFYAQAQRTTIKLAPTTRLPHLDQVPTPPTSGGQKLELLFYVTEGATITGLRFGEVDVGICNVVVPKKDAK